MNISRGHVVTEPNVMGHKYMLIHTYSSAHFLQVKTHFPSIEPSYIVNTHAHTHTHTQCLVRKLVNHEMLQQKIESGSRNGVGSQMAERLGNRAINQKVAGSMTLCPWASYFTLLASGNVPVLTVSLLNVL